MDHPCPWIGVPKVCAAVMLCWGLDHMGNDVKRIAVIIGSVRPGSYTSKAAALAENELMKTAGIAVDRFDPVTLHLPLPGAGDADGALLEARRKVSSAEAVMFATPEYHGSFSSVTKLIIDNLDFPSALKGKPVALLGVAAGRIGAVKALEHLRSVCSHVGALVLPGSVSVANVQAVFDQEGNCLDSAIERRIRNLSRELVDYLRRQVAPRECSEEMARGTGP